MQKRVKNVPWQHNGWLVQLLKELEDLTRLFCCQTSPISVKFPFATLTEKKLNEMEFLNMDVFEIREKILEGLRSKFYGYKNDRFVLFFFI